jgi:hypothetical protein
MGNSRLWERSTTVHNKRLSSFNAIIGAMPAQRP